MFNHIQHWATNGAVRAVDVALIRFIHANGHETAPAVLLALLMTSEAHRHGHLCLALTAALAHPEQLFNNPVEDGAVVNTPPPELFAQWRALTLPDLIEQLTRSSAVANYMNAAPERDDVRMNATPFVLAGTLDHPRLYLRRVWHSEQCIIHGINARLQTLIDLPTPQLRELLDSLFTPIQGGDQWQRIACALAARRQFAIITGGPGTGKTTTVLRLLALLQGIAIKQQQPPLHIRLAAPTGKAAARLNAAIAGHIQSLPVDESIRAAIPTSVTTIHRLLGARAEKHQFHYHANHLLPADLVVIDEASMVDVELFAALLNALHSTTRLILLGDKDQLASVEAGAVLGELCRRADAAHYTPTTVAWLEQVTGAVIEKPYLDQSGTALDQAVVMLRTSYRFNQRGGIGLFAALVNQFNPESFTERFKHIQQLFDKTAVNQSSKPSTAAANLIDSNQLVRIQLQDTTDPALRQLIIDGYRDYLELVRTPPALSLHSQMPHTPVLDQWAQQILNALGQFQLLSVVRQGNWGVEGLNRTVIHILQRAKLLPDLSHLPPEVLDHHWFIGRPVLITRNDYRLGLMNGDVGVTLALPIVDTTASHRQVLRVAFPANDGSQRIRWLLPSRLQAVETVFATTVHKAQGSEFNRVALVLPPASNPILTCELLYTAITRARQQFTLLLQDEAVLASALTQRVQRTSGLALALD
ncbi:exodeoxyribonuclease V subunit alpha [Rhodoferax sp. 4810]|uniref:RecBCD enzyme subunit RecD n=1 Tax=Thiospirillum jenense TaxID=1653858 RepID=A0A839HDA2_9GAMM|nr:exodeoxyribonuclease V subunit alpha [Thiospirillum jenense]MBB1075850.1 exodeoxyribonuclease V subunit alpha [Rhodoferax jenense]MBB1126925.1 exodeoxyribonuclease V subunit alpha [Thiospirillum jenense]